MPSEANVPYAEESLARIAESQERIVTALRKLDNQLLLISNSLTTLVKTRKT